MKFIITSLIAFFLLAAPAFAQSKPQYTLKDYEKTPHCAASTYDLTQKFTDVVRKGKVIAMITEPATEIMDNGQKKKIKDAYYRDKGQKEGILSSCNAGKENTDKWRAYCPLISHFTSVYFHCDTKEECVETALRECLPK
ncbi:MAG: hypothetical protein LBF41_03845 [Deltaproteobacteria bacterium]|jgi:hypothetical protein|nr:hypothetical protein [Deltaproteobacteria bacterium]